MRQKVNFAVKRCFDIFVSAAGLILLSPLLLILALLVRVNLGSPVFFRQERPGLHEKIFRLYKFRSMSDARDRDGNLLPDSQRLTRFGRILRSTSLDELPEAWNILRGDMSVIGPRPWGPLYLPYYTEEEHHRHDVRPGLSGLAQVHGRTAATWDDRLKYDLDYVRHVSLAGDIKIIFLTVLKALQRSDVAGAEVQGNFDDYRSKQLEEAKEEKEQHQMKK